MTRNKWTDSEIELMKKYYINGLDYIQKIIKNHTKASIVKKAGRLKLKTKKTRYEIDEIKKIVKVSYSYSEVFRNMNKSKSGDSFSYLRRFIENNFIDISHFDSYKNNKGIKKDISEWLISGSNIGSHHLKNKLYEHGLKKRICEICTQNEIWNGSKMSLILDHINGINNDNRIENLRILCPNCNATLETHCKKIKTGESHSGNCK